MLSITAKSLKKSHLDTFLEIFAADGRKAVKIWDSKKLMPGSRAHSLRGDSNRLYVKLGRLNAREITRLAARISEMDASSDQHLCVLR